MNTDSFFESEFFNENKRILTICITVSLAMVTIIYLYFNLKSDEIPRNMSNSVSSNQTNLQNIQSGQLTNSKVIQKRRLTINAQDILYKDLTDIDISFVYQVIDFLAQAFDVYLIIIVEENDNLDNITEKFSVLIDDKLVLKHVNS
jgi:hypothetical protein